MRGSTLYSIIYLLFTLNAVFATHFRYGNIVWRIPDPDNFPTTVEFKVSLSYKLSVATVIPTIGSLLSPGGLDFGDGTNPQPIQMVVNIVDNVLDLLQGSYVVIHTYAGVNATNPKTFTAAFYSGGRLANLNNNALTFFNVSTTVNVYQYVTNRRGASVLNQSPVASLFPVMTAHSNTVSTFRIPAYDRETQALTFSLASAADMGTSTDTQPSGLSVAATGVVTFNTNGVAPGYWNSQIKISDGNSYVVVDFIIFVMPAPVYIPCLVPSTPLDGLVYTIYANTLFSVNIAVSLSVGILPAVTSSLLPGNALLSNPIAGSAILSWTPSLKDIGTYAITLGCRNGNGLTCPLTCQSSFILNVVAPYCGSGSVSPASCNISTTACACVCPSGFDPLKNCSTCLPGFYGANCTACNCVYGTCNSGSLSSTGTCTCFSGYKGLKCDQLVKPCNFSVPGYVRQLAYTATNLVNPTSTVAFITGAASLVNVSIALPTIVPKIDVMILVDTSATISVSVLLNLQAALAVNFLGLVGGLSANVYFGLSTFTNPTTCLLSLNLGVRLGLTASSTDLLAALALYLQVSVNVGCVTKPQGNQLGAIIGAATTTSGWRSDAFKVIIVVTDTVFGEGNGQPNNYSNRAAMRSALLALNAIPIFVTPSTVQSAYTNLTNDIGFGLAVPMLASWSNAYTAAFTGIKTALSTVWTVLNDPQGLVRSVTSATTNLIAPVNNTVYMTLKAANQTVAPVSDIAVQILGWGIATLTPQVNQAPVTQVSATTTREDIGVNVPLNGTDADGDSLTVIIDTLPINGKLYVSSTNLTLLSVNSAFALPDGSANSPFIYYVPNLHFSGTDFFKWHLSDYCTNSATSNASLTITFYNYPPTVVGFTTQTNESTNLVVQLQVSDVEDTPARLVSFIRSLPDSSMGSLVHINNGSAVQINDQLASTVLHTVRFVPKLYACCDTTSFTYQVRDTGNASSDIATASVFIVHVNQPPTASAYSPVSSNRGVPVAIVLTVSDPDAADIETFTISSVGSSGTYQDASNTTIATPYSLATVTIGSGSPNTATQTIYFTSLWNSSASSSFSFYVTDAGGLQAATINVAININPDQPPVATAVALVSSLFNSQSSVYYLQGTDPDAVDVPSTLQIVVNSLPTKGTLTVNGILIASSALPLTVANNASFYVSGNSIAGTDQFTFYVVDVMGTASSVQTVPLQFTAVNRPPTASISSITTLEDTEVVGQIVANDPDGNTITIHLVSLPSSGTIKQYDGTPITALPAVLTDPNFQFRFLPALHAYGSPYTTFTFYADDNSNTVNSQSSQVTSTISVTFFNYPPTAISASFSIPEESSATSITLNVTDIETPSATVAILVTLPPTSAGVLTDNNGNALSAGSSISSPWTLQFTPTPQYVGPTSFQFKANDGTQDSSTPVTLFISVTHVNFPPTSQVYLGQAVRQVSFPISLVASDPNLGDTLTVTISAYAGLGEFTYPDSIGSRRRGVFAPAPFNLPYTLSIGQSRSTSTVINFLAPGNAAGTNYANISFFVTDQTGLSSAVTYTSIDIAADNPPTANPVGTIQATQDSKTSPFTVSGTDLDVADVNNLQVILLVLPTLGTLYFANGTAVTGPAPVILSYTSAVSLTYLTTQRGSDSFSFAVQDLVGTQSAPMSVSINITNVNHPPTAQWLGAVTGLQNGVATINEMGASDPDADDSVFAYYIDVPPYKGTLTQADGTVCASYPCLVASSSAIMLYSPVQNGYGSPYVNFSFYVVDSHGARSSVSAIGIISISHVNQPPVASPSFASGDENTNVTVSLNITDIDSPASSLSIIILSLPASSLGYLTTQSGAIVHQGDVVALQNLVFVPVAYASGSTNFSFQATDGQAYSNVTSCSITVNFVRHPPTCTFSVPSPIYIARSSVVNFNLVSKDPDQGETYTFYLASFAQTSDASGTLSSSSSQISASTSVIGTASSTGTYTPLAVSYSVTGVITSLNFTFYVSDGTYNSGNCAMQLLMTDNTPPVAYTPSPVTTQEQVMSGSIVMNGTDPDDQRPVRVVISSLPQHGVLYVNSSYTIQETGPLPAGVYSVTYMPTGLFYGSDSYTYVLQDANGMYSPTQTVSITVQHVNHLPTASVGPISAVENTPLNITQILANDIDGDTLSIVLTGPPTFGNFTLLDGTPITSYPATIPAPFQFTFVPSTLGYGQSNFTFYVTDGTGNTAPITATINVAFVNNAPVAQTSTLSLLENAVATNFTLTVNDVDSLQSALVARIQSLPPASLGTVTTVDGSAVSVGQIIQSPRILTFTPAAYSYGSGSVTFTARDETLYSSNTGIVSITVTHVNHAPQVSGPSTIVATRAVQLVIPLYATDKDSGDTVTFSLTSLSLASGVLTSSPTGASITSAGTFYTGTIANSGASLTPSLYFTAPANAVGNSYASFTFTAADQAGATANSFTVTVSIAPDNAPTANPASISVTQDQSSSPVTLTGNDADAADANSLQIYITALPTKGTLSMGGTAITATNTIVTGPIVYSTNERGTDSFSFQVVDNVGGTSAVQSVPISITSVNHPPTVTYSGSGINADENTNVVVNQVSASDPDGDTVTVYIASLPGVGSLQQYDGTPITAPDTPITDPQYRVIYVPGGADQTSQTTNFTIYGSDGQGNSNSNTSAIIIPVSVAHIDRPPIAYSSTLALPHGATVGTITPNVTDSDSLATSLSITIQSLPDSSICQLTYNGSPVTVGQVIQYPFSNMEVTIVSGAAGYTTFTFSASDGVATTPNYATYGIGVKSAINSPPVASATSSYTAQRGAPLAISLGAHDNDFLETFTYSVTALSAGGVFSSGGVLTPPEFSITASQDQTRYVTNAILMFTAPVLAAGSSYLTLSFNVSDGIDTSNSVSIVVGIMADNPPSATFSGSITYNEDGNSTSFSLSGTDPDPADANSLQVIFTALPTLGTLYLVGGGPVTIGTQYPTSSSFFIVGTPLEFGGDSFTYYIIDPVGGTSAPLQVPVTVNFVNHQPAAAIHNPQGVMNQPITLQIYGTDVDPDTTLTGYISQLPTVGTLEQLDGTAITSASPSSPVAITSSSGKIIYIPPTNAYGANVANFDFYVADNSGASNSNSATSTAIISIARADLPPVASDSSINVADGGNVSIALSSSDPQGYSVIATIVVFPTSGALYTSAGVPITPSNPTVGSDGIVVYVPVKGNYGQNFTFSFQVTSTQSSQLSSNTATVTASVYRVYDAPVFTGQTFYSIPENSVANLLFTGSSEASSYAIEIVASPAIGSFYFVDGDQQTDITGLQHYLMNNSDSENRAKFAPPTNTSGDNLVFITVQVVDVYGTSTPVNITISVYHINVAPTVVPTTYTVNGVTNNWSTQVTIPENSCSAIAWDIYDPDSLKSNLSSLISSLPFRGKLYNYLADGTAGDVITSQQVIMAAADGFYHVIYCPDEGKSGNNFASFSIIASDNIYYSDRRYANMKVTHVNANPVIDITQYIWNTTVTLPTLVTGVSLVDSDATFFSVQLVISLSFNGVSQDARQISLFNYDDTICTNSSDSIICVGSLAKLNAMLNQVGLGGQENAGNYSINFYFDDLGDGTNIGAKNASDSVIVEVIEADSTKKAGNNNVLTATVASAAVVGAAAAAGVYGYLRKRSPPTSTFFGLEHGLANGVINENPLYEGGVVMENSLYRAPTFGMQKL